MKTSSVYVQQYQKLMAAKALLSVRSQFVEKVTLPVLKQILDELLEKKVINDNEKDAILEGDSIRADRARNTIDIVRKKGDIPSRTMIRLLQNRDNSLYTDLGLCWTELDNQQARANPEPKTDDQSVYPVTEESRRNRVALLITNIEFTHLEKRPGAEKDEENMDTLLSKLQYNVVKYTNLSAKEIEEALSEFSKDPKLEKTDSVMIVIMSHGKQGVICGINYQNQPPVNEIADEFDIDQIYQLLGPERCPSLVDKPKVIIIQACRGEKDGFVLVSDIENRAFDSDECGGILRSVHKEKDFICLLSCTKDTVSYREPVRGSLLIQYIVEVFNTSAQKDHIEELFRKVMQRFEEFEHPIKKQMPTKDRCTFTKNFFF